IRAFGLFTGFGILSALVIELTIVPAVRAMLPTPRRREREREAAAHPWLDAFLRASARAASGRGRWQVFAGAAVLIAACAVFASRIQIDMSTKRRRRSEEHTSELQSLAYLVCRLLLEKKNKYTRQDPATYRKSHD